MISTSHSIADADEGIRLDRWFKRHFPQVTHGLLEKTLRKGLIRVDGKKAKSSDRLSAAQVIEIKGQLLEVAKESKAKAQIVDASDAKYVQSLVLFKDANVIIVNKPFGLAVQGGSKIARSLDDLLDGLKFDGKERPKLTHRLDRDTSGVLVLARHTNAATYLMRMFTHRKIDKTYWALVNGCPLQLAGTVDLPIRKKESPKLSGRAGGPEGRDYEIMQVDEAEGQKATTEYRVLDQLARKFALMELKPLTGRTHQLRVHMQAIGCPILGDHKYGGETDAGEALGVENILHLHARRIVIPALPGGKKIDVTAPLPPHMKKSFKALGIDQGQS